MYYAAVCEDEPDISRYISKTLAVEFEKHNTQVSFETFDNGNKLLNMVNEHHHFDIVFMDIEMPEIDGITVCRRLREITEDTLVIFISNKDELVFSTFEVQPFRFVRKSHYDSLLPSLVPAVVAELQRRNPVNIKITETSSGDIFSFDINQVTYIEANGKTCFIHMNNSSETEVKIKLMNLEEQLSAYEFIKPHRSYLVNYKFISVIKKSNIELMDGSLIPISRDKVESVKHEFIKYTNRSI